MKKSLRILKITNHLLFSLVVTSITLNGCILADHSKAKQLKTQLENQRCPIEYQSLCNCKYDADPSLKSLSIHIICSLNKNDVNKNFKNIPKINVSSYKFAEFLTHIDLSNTLIAEIPTDSFHVGSKFIHKTFDLFQN